MLVVLCYEKSRWTHAFVLIQLPLFRQGSKLASMFFPMLAVESGDGNFLDRGGIQATHVNAAAIGIRPRNIKRLDAAYFAKQMLSHTGVDGS